mgnify:CR=1 FL=1
MGKRTVQMLGFDLGATCGRAVLGEFNGERISYKEIYRFPNEPVRLNSNLYWDILRIWREMKKGIKKTLAEGVELSSIAVDTWGVDYGLVDKQGRLFSNPYHYRDQRTASVMSKVVEELGADYLYGCTGIQFLSFNTIFQLAADLMENKGIIDLTDKVLLMPDLFNYFLSGVQAAEYSIATTTGLLNFRSKVWDQELLAKMGFPIEKLPPIIPPGTVLGPLTPELCCELGCKPIPVVAVAGHDTASALAATPLKPGNAFISSGTWSLMGMERDEPVVTPSSRKYNFTNEGGIDYSIRLLKNINGLWLIQECQRIWQQDDPNLDFSSISNLASKAKPFKSIVNSADQRFFAPLNMVEEVQQYCRETGQQIPEGIGEIARCIYEGIALEYRLIAEQIQIVTGERLKGIHIVGGGSKDEFLSQLTADLLEVPVTTGPVGATIIGNLVVQLMSMGLIQNLKEAREVVKKSFQLKEYWPRQTKSWEKFYQAYLRLVEK